MFDDLHDPNPPAPDMAALAAVSGRARAIRRRRLAVVSSLSTVAVVAVAVAVVARDDDPGRIAIVDDPSVTESPVSDAPAPTDPPDTSGTGQTDPAVVPSSDTPPTSSAAPVDCPADGLRYVGAGLSAVLAEDAVVVEDMTTDDLGPIHAERSVTIDEDGTTISIGRFFDAPSPEFVGIVETDDGWVGREDKGRAWVAVSADDRDRVECILQTIVYEPELELLDAQDERLVTAIDGSGDAVVLSWNGEPTVLHDGTDPDDALPEEGEVTFVDGVAVPFREDDVWIGVCCEPVAGSLLRTPIGTVATYDNAAAGFGHAPVLSPDDRYLAAIDYLGVQIRDLDSGDQAVIDLQADVYQQATKAVWIGSDVLAVQIDSDTERSIAFYSVVDGEAAEISRTVIATGTAGAEWLVELVGVSGPPVMVAGSEPLIWLWNREEATLVAHGSLNVFSGTMSEGVVTRDLAADATVVKVVGNEVRWVDESRRLWRAPLDDLGAAQQIRGEYVWVG